MSLINFSYLTKPSLSLKLSMTLSSSAERVWPSEERTCFRSSPLTSPLPFGSRVVLKSSSNSISFNLFPLSFSAGFAAFLYIIKESFHLHKNIVLAWKYNVCLYNVSFMKHLLVCDICMNKYDPFHNSLRFSWRGLWYIFVLPNFWFSWIWGFHILYLRLLFVFLLILFLSLPSEIQYSHVKVREKIYV